MKLSLEDRELICYYMGWFKHIYFNKYDEPIYFQEGVAGDIVFDLNDAGLCVEKMVEKGDWEDFQIKIYFSDMATGLRAHEFVAWLFNADNFFQAMAELLRSKK